MLRPIGILLLFSCAFCCPVSAQLIIETIAGGGSLEGRPAAQTPMGDFTPSAVAPDGTVYLSYPAQLMAISPAGILRNIAGTGVPGFSGDGQPAVKAQIYGGSISLDAAGNLYLADQNRIRMITTDGVIRTIAGNGYPATGTDVGPAFTTNVSPQALAVDTAGNVFFANRIVPPGAQQHSILRLGKDGNITAYSGLFNGDQGNGDNGPATAADIVAKGLAMDSRNQLLVLEPADVRRIRTDGIIERVISCDANGEPISGTNLGGCRNTLGPLLMGPNGTIYVGGHSGSGPGIWKADGGATSKVVSGGSLAGVDTAANVYFTQSFSPTRLFRLDPAGYQTTLTGTGALSSPDDSPAKGVILDNRYRPLIAIDSGDRLLFVEPLNCRVRFVDASGKLGTLAGTGTCATTANAGPIPTTALCVAAAFAASKSGSAFLSCVDGSVVRINPTQQVLSVVRAVAPGRDNCQQMLADANEVLYCAGSQLTSISPDGNTVPILIPPGNSPLVDTMALSPNGTLYVVDGFSFYYNVYTPSGSTLTLKQDLHLPRANRLPCLVIDQAGRFIQCDGYSLQVTTGSSTLKLGLATGYGFAGEGGPLQSAQVGFPRALVQDSKGRLYLGDAYYRVIRRISGALPSIAPGIAANGVVNAASYAGGAVSAGELIAIFGNNFSQNTAAFRLNDVRIDQALLSTKVLISGIEVPVVSVSPGQVNAIVPWLGTSIKNASITVQVDGISSEPVVVPYATAVPGVFTADGSGSGQGSIVNQDGSVNSTSTPARAGSIVSVFGTGGGALLPDLLLGYLAIASDLSYLQANATAKVGEVEAQVLYAGAAPYLVAGVNQFNVLIPANTPPGPADLTITVAGKQSNRVTVQVR